MNTKKQDQFISKENKKRILLCVNALLMVVLIVVATYAWFSRNTVDDVNVNEIAFQGSSDLEVSLNGTDYASVQTLKFNSSSLAQDITGDGKPSSFVHPSITPYGSNESILVPDSNTGSWDTSISGIDEVDQTKSSDFKIKTIYFRSNNPMKVYLGDGSQVLGAAEVSGKKLVGSSEEVGNKSTVQEVKDASNADVSVSKDCIVGATRFAFLDSSEDPTVKCLWIPRPNIFYETSGSGESLTKTIHISDKLSDTYNINTSSQAYQDSATHYYYIKEEANRKTFDSNKVIAGSTGLSTSSGGNTNTTLLELTTPSDGYYKGSIKVVIWVEGCDAEARQAFAGGKFGATLRFVGVEPSGS